MDSVIQKLVYLKCGPIIQIPHYSLTNEFMDNLRMEYHNFQFEIELVTLTTGIQVQDGAKACLM